VSDLDAYRERIGVPGPLHPDLTTLHALHAAHLRTIPFENASVLFGEPIELDADAFVHKLGVLRRGGFCYELNGAFAVLLRSIGFQVDLLEARGHEAGGRLGPRFDHLALRVTLGEPWLADVGFGYSFVEPLRLVTGVEQIDPAGAFRLTDAGDGLDLEWRHRDGRWVPHYRVALRAHDLGEFAETCRYQQTAPGSPFVGRWNCVIAGPGGGGTTLSGRHYIATDGTTRDERDLTDAEIIEILETAFSVRAQFHDGRWSRRESA
jgi:N-hydroxyarylamine O-acetyltransferase